MNRFVLSLALAALPALASAQSADVGRLQAETPSSVQSETGRSQLETAAARTLARLGIDVDASSLTVNQLGAIHNFASSSDNQADGHIRQVVN